MPKSKEEVMEISHLIDVLKSTQRALLENDSFKLKELSNQTIHSSAIQQTRGEIIIPVIIYALSKIAERKEGLTIEEKEWDNFVKKFNDNLTKAIEALEEGDYRKFESSLENELRLMETITSDIKERVKEVLRKAFVNKASRLYEHGISLERTAEILGISQWELLEYTGQTGISDVKESISYNVKRRAAMALEFFGGAR